MTLFEVTDRDGEVLLIDCDMHGVSAESGGPIVHDFAGIKHVDGWRANPDHTLRFVAPQSVREVPA